MIRWGIVLHNELKVFLIPIDLCFNQTLSHLPDRFGTPLILAAYDTVHFFRRFFAASSQPHFYYFVKTAFEKFNEIFDMLVIKVLPCQINIVIVFSV